MTELNETESGELVVIKEVDIPALFKEKGCDPIIEGLKKKAAEFEGDISTAKGRKAIASFAAKFSTVKTKMDGFGKALSDEYRAKIAPINEERNKIKACCDESRDKVRKPLTDWEDAEKERVAKHEQNIQTINDYLNVEVENSTQAKELLDGMKAFDTGEVFEEFELAATKAKDAALTQLEAKFIVLQHAEKEKTEADRLEKERLEKEQEDREAKIAEDAAEAARIETEEKARIESEEKDRLTKEAIDEAEKKTLEAKLETERVERESREAADNAEEDKRVAIEAELNRLAAIKEDERIADEKLAKNKVHRGKLNKEAKQSFIDEGFEGEEAERIIKVIAKGRIANITINYGA